MISEHRYDEAYVWLWLPGKTEPIVVGRISRAGDRLAFNYGRSYLERPDAIPIYEPELPLKRGEIFPEGSLSMAGCLRDGAPDAWGRRVILNRRGMAGKGADTGLLDELTYLLESGSDRAGALDYQMSSATYEPRGAQPETIENLLSVTEKVEQGVPLSEELDQALFHGSSLGGARPKVGFQDNSRKWIAKFSSSSDIHNTVKGEFVAMRLAFRLGLSVAPVRLERVADKDVLLVERFDRVSADKGWLRRGMVSALTLFGLDEMMARYASYAVLAEIIRHRFTRPKNTLRELFGRLVFNVLCGNTDDHARNHAAFWDGSTLSLTPAYDICPQQNRTGNEASQAMSITDDDRRSQLTTCLKAAPDFCLGADAAEAIIEEQVHTMADVWSDVANEADLAPNERTHLASRIFFNPFIFEGAPARFVATLTP